MKLSVSILSSKNREEDIKKLNKTNIDYFHIDVMDGKFVNNFQMQPSEIEELSLSTKKPLDIHLMVENPIDYINKININNIEYITFHIEVKHNIDEIINKIKEKKCKVGISIKPNTDINTLKPYLDKIDLILVMSVEPGFGGQPFLETTDERLKEINNLIKDKNILTEVDGGVKDTTIDILKRNNVDIAVSGSYIINATNLEDNINILKN